MSTKRKAEDQESEAIKKAKKLAEEEAEAEGEEEEGEEEDEDDLDGEDGEGEEDDDLEGNYLYSLHLPVSPPEAGRKLTKLSFEAYATV